MCLDHSLRLYLRGLHLFKILIAVYMLIPAIQLLSDTTIPQAFGTDMILIGVVILLMALVKPCNVAVGHYGSIKHNKFALLCIMVFDTALGLVQFGIGLTLLVRGTPEVGLSVREACGAREVPSGYSSDCSTYWRSDRTAGMRLAWESMFYIGERQGHTKTSKELGSQQDDYVCCGFGPPIACDRVQNSEKFPDNLNQAVDLGRDMLKQRFTCSDLYDCPSNGQHCWYPAEPGTCEHYAPADVGQENPLGCRYDFGVGSCIDREVRDDTVGCAAGFEDFMAAKIYMHGVIFLGSLVLEVCTVLSACFFCWKRKADDVLPITYVYDEPFDPTTAPKFGSKRKRGDALPTLEGD
ncbi:hypothetical protein M885DRAFT_509766 [Pelagophyceae sp. CCMP2097]|nr:hypothetical protein M885DRAFT_509766 [Pelagophyceae sp. CCMP2097]